MQKANRACFFAPAPSPCFTQTVKKRYNKLINDRVAAGRRIPRIAEGRIPRVGLQSIQYILFLAVAAAVYLHLPRRGQPPFLLAASLVFYAMADCRYLLVTLGVGAFSYLCGRGIAWRGGAHKTAFVRLGVAGSLAILAFFKYFGFLETALALPFCHRDAAGHQFYSFAAISYIIDAGRGDCEVERNPLYHFLFLTFFGTVTQGPIPRAGSLIPQLRAEHRFDAERTVRALRLYGLGLFKMVAVSDVLGVLVDEVFGSWQNYGGLMLVLAVVFYTFQLYFNFSGYSELARATGLLLGLELPENFKTPFFATNFSGFWSRWHISFSSWLQDYLFMPLAWADTERLTGGRLRRLSPEVCVFIVFFCVRVLAWQHFALCGVGPFAGTVPRGRRTAPPPPGQTQKESACPCAVGQARRRLCAVDAEHGVLPHGVR